MAAPLTSPTVIAQAVGADDRNANSSVRQAFYVQSYHGYLYLRIYGHHGYMYLDSPGHRLESQTEKIEKRIKNESPSELPDSAQGPLEGSNPLPHSLGLGLGPLAYLCC